MKQQITFFRCACWLCLALSMLPIAAVADGGDAGAQLRSQLDVKGLSVGYDPESGTIVAIGECARDVPDISDQKFLKKRGEMFKLAIFDAKREIIHSLATKMTVHETVTSSASGDQAMQTTASYSEMFSRQMLRGYTVEAIAESYEGGVYQVAVALSWSSEAETEVAKALTGVNPAASENGEAEWQRWASSTDFAKAMNFCRFKDSRGILRFVGIGIVDIDGKDAKGIIQAKRTVRLEAQQALAYALFSDVTAHDVATTILKEKSSGSGDEVSVEEDFLSRVTQKCKLSNLHTTKVYEGKHVLALTGGKVLVWAEGIEPSAILDIK